VLLNCWSAGYHPLLQTVSLCEWQKSNNPQQKSEHFKTMGRGRERKRLRLHWNTGRFGADHPISVLHTFQ